MERFAPVPSRLQDPSAGACVGCGESVDGARCERCGAARRAGRWVMERVLAHGPHSRVYVARDGTGATVALKELLFTAVPGVEELDAFEREVETLRRLAHPAIPRFVEAFREGTGVGLRLYLATELVVGETLASRIARGTLGGSEALVLTQRLLDVLAYLHGRTPPVLHRDVKPANVVLRSTGEPALVDFGSVRVLARDRTHGSTLVGTLGYMPPEQLGGTVDRTSDLYALGATVLHALTGIAPGECLGPDLTLDVPAGLPRPFDAWLPRVLARDPAARPRDVAEARRALSEPPATGLRRRVGWRTAVAVATLSAVGWSVALSRGGARTSPVVASPSRPAPARSASWLERVRPRCNPVEVGQALLRDPPPQDARGVGMAAACLSLAGRVDAARDRILGLPPAERARASAAVFKAGHPVADMGDDVAALPLMRLVLQFWPENYQALYHAGISEYALGHADAARPLLERFLAMYRQDDGFTSSARAALRRIEAGLPPEPGHGAEH